MRDELVPEKGFGLFVDRVKQPVKASKDVEESRFALRSRGSVDVADVIDLHELPIPALEAKPDEPAPELSLPTKVVEREERINVAQSGAFSGLKVTKRAPIEAVLGVRAPGPVAPVPFSAVAKPELPVKTYFSGVAARLSKLGQKAKVDKPVTERPDALPGKANAKAKAPSAVKEKSKKAVSTDKPGASIDVLVSLESSREVLWRVTAKGLYEVAASDVRRVLSFTGADKHFKVSQAMRDGTASDYVLSEVGEPVRLINMSKTLGSIYCTTASRVLQKAPIHIGPGLLVLEQLLQKDREANEPLLCGLVLQDANAGTGLVILYHVSALGDISDVQVTANVDNVNFVLAQFAASNRVDLATTKVVLFNNEDLLGGASRAQTFPLEQEYFGVSLSTLTGYAAIIAIAGAVGTSAYAFKNYAQMHAVQTSLATAQAEKREAQKSLDTHLLGAVKSFSVTQSVNLEQASARAARAWVEGSKVVMEATAKQETYVVTMPLTKAGLVSGNPSLLGQVTKDAVSPLLSMVGIEGCTKSTPAISGGMNALQISITCENNLGLFSAYWPS